MKALLKVCTAIAAGLAAGAIVVLSVGLYPPIIQAVRAKPTICSVGAAAYAPVAQLRRAAGEKYAKSRTRLIREGENRLALVSNGSWQAWVSMIGSENVPTDILAHLTSEHEWMDAHNPDAQVRPGDIVFDCGAHVGTFSRFALDHGAAKVVAFEPMEQSLECLRRNFAAEMKSGRYIIVPKAVWKVSEPLSFAVSDFTSGTNSAVLQTGQKHIQVSATTIDATVAELGLSKVTYIKMDIEGAEREALAGARNTLARFKPRLMIESYHLPDDSEVLPRTILAAQPAYKMECGPCGVKHGRFIPYVLYFQ